MTNFELFIRAIVAGAGFTVGAIGVVFVGLMFAVIVIGLVLACIIGGIAQEGRR